MYRQTVGRSFQIWEYHVSHGSLLIRSPAVGECITNIDFIFSGVKYISGPTILGEIEVMIPDEKEVLYINGIIGNPVRKVNVWKFINHHEPLIVAGAFMNFSENDLGIFSTPFEWKINYNSDK